MNRMLAVCFLVVTIVAGVGMFAVRQASVRAQNPPMRRGVSVAMAETKNAVAEPEADGEDAWVVAVTRDGRTYFGTDQVTPKELLDRMMKTPRNRTAKLYIKADAGAEYESVERVLNLGRQMAFETQVLLTSQPETGTPGTVVPPKGLEVEFKSDWHAGPVVAVYYSAQKNVVITVGHDVVPLDAMQSKLQQLLKDQSVKQAMVMPGERVKFGEVAQVIDACRGAGARVLVDAPSRL